MKYRVYSDSFGKVQVPENVHYGPQTKRSLIYFNVAQKTDKIPVELVKSLVILKLCASRVNSYDGRLEIIYLKAIETACLEILLGKHDCEFPLVIWQTGSGTQTNMNVNEVISSLSNCSLGQPIGSHFPIHPNDHVNYSQSSNDLIPSAINISCVLSVITNLLPALNILSDALNKKKLEFLHVVKVGRTHLQDAVPMTVGQEFSGYIDQIKQNYYYICNHLTNVCELAIGGTAVGTGLNALPEFDILICREIDNFIKGEWKFKIENIEPEIIFRPAKNKFSALSGHDAVCVLSGLLMNLACALIRLGSDFTLLSSGPRCGLAEFKLPANEPGSSIMPGKVNPTQCESLCMVCVQVMGNHQAVSIGASRGVLELNVFKPLIAANVLHSIRLLSDSCKSFALNCVSEMEVILIIYKSNSFTFKICHEKIKYYVDSSLMLVTPLNRKIGYEKASIMTRWAQENKKNLIDAVKKFNFLSLDEYNAHVDPYAMTNVGFP